MMTKRQLYLLLLILGNTSGQGGLRTLTRRSRSRGMNAVNFFRHLNIFDPLSEEGTNLDILERHPDDLEERNVFVKSPNENPEPPPTLSNGPISSPPPSTIPETETPAPTPVSTEEDTEEDPDDVPDDDEASSPAPAPSAVDSTPSPTTGRGGITPTPTTEETTAPDEEEDPTESPTAADEDETTEPPTTVDVSGPSKSPSSPNQQEPSISLSPAGNQTPSPATSPSSTPGPTLPDGEATALGRFLEGTVDDTESLLADGTPQNLALRALETSNPELDPEDPDDQIQILQRYALNTLYFSTDGDQWIANTKWTTASPLCDEDGKSSWLGVVCGKDAPQVIERLSMAGNDMVGQLPAEIALLTSLSKFCCICYSQRIKLSTRDLRSPLYLVAEINLFENSIEGPLPASLGRLSNLASLELGSNFLSGTLPASVGNMTALEILSITKNLFTGSLPTEIGNLIALQTMGIAINNFTGPLPKEMMLLPELGTE